MSWHSQQQAFDAPQSIAGLVSPQQVQSPIVHTSSPDRKRKRTLTASDLDHIRDGDHNGLQAHADTSSVGGGGRGSVSLAGSPSQQNGSKARHQPGVKRACNDCRQQKVWISYTEAAKLPGRRALYRYTSTDRWSSYGAMSLQDQASSTNRATGASSMASAVVSTTASSDSASALRTKRWSESWSKSNID